MNLHTEETETTRTLATFLADLRFEKLPRPVIERTKELFLDWIASAEAGCHPTLRQDVAVHRFCAS